MAIFEQYEFSGNNSGVSLTLPPIPSGKRLKIFSVNANASTSVGAGRTFSLRINGVTIASGITPEAALNITNILDWPIILKRTGTENFNLDIVRESNSGAMNVSVFGIIEDNI